MRKSKRSSITPMNLQWIYEYVNTQNNKLNSRRKPLTFVMHKNVIQNKRSLILHIIPIKVFAEKQFILTFILI